MSLTPTVLESLAKTLTQATSFSEAAFWLSLHSANPGTSGTSEITNGTGAQARQQVTFSGSGGTDTNTTGITIQVAAGHTVTWVGAWTAQTGGTFLGGFPVIGQQLMATATVALAPDVTCPAHGLSVNQPVRLYAVPGTNSAVPTGFTADTVYYVVSAPDANTLTLSATMGGGAISATSAAGFVLAEDNSQTFASTGNITFPMTTGVVYEQV